MAMPFAWTEDITPIKLETHKTRHQDGGADEIKLDDLGTPDDNTDLDVSITAHGLVPKAPNDRTKFLRGDGIWARDEQAELDALVNEYNSLMANERYSSDRRGFEIR
jgi:hypothetical protein